jgi:hypothetical protein
MESAETKANNAFLNYLVDCLCKPKAAEVNEEFATIDGDFVSESAIDKALKTGKGMIVGGFFVGGFSSEVSYGCSI